MSFKIRPAMSKDVFIVLEFIKELAEYENLLDEVEADEVGLNSYLFSENPSAFVLLAELDDKPIGFALYHYNFSTFTGKPGLHVEDLYIRDEHRGKGYGKKLLGFLAKKTVAENLGRMEWWVLDWNKPSIDVYKSIGAKQMNEFIIQRLAGSKLKTFAEAN